VKLTNWLRRQADIDQLLIFFLLGVTITQMGYYLASFQPSRLFFVGYLQAIAVDAAIWRSAWWYRRYTGKKQRRWALTGVVGFALVSAWYNYGFYTLQKPSLPWWQRALMGAVLPAGVALLSYMKGVKDVSKFAVGEDEAPVFVPKPSDSELLCAQCGRIFAWPLPYANQRAAQNAMNAHRCETQ
jgi:hypothetical protein